MNIAATKYGLPQNGIMRQDIIRKRTREETYAFESLETFMLDIIQTYQGPAFFKPLLAIGEMPTRYEAFSEWVEINCEPGEDFHKTFWVWLRYRLESIQDDFAFQWQENSLDYDYWVIGSGIKAAIIATQQKCESTTMLALACYETAFDRKHWRSIQEIECCFEKTSISKYIGKLNETEAKCYCPETDMDGSTYCGSCIICEGWKNA